MINYQRHAWATTSLHRRQCHLIHVACSGGGARIRLTSARCRALSPGSNASTVREALHQGAPHLAPDRPVSSPSAAPLWRGRPSHAACWPGLRSTQRRGRPACGRPRVQGHRLARLLRAGASGVSACGALHAANSPTNTNAPTVLVAMRFPLLVMQDTTPNLRRRGCDGCRAPAVRSYGGRCKPCADFSAVCGSIRARGTDCTLLSAQRGRYASRLRRASSGRLLALF